MEMEKEHLLYIGEDGIAREYKEPFATIECQTEEDYEYIKSAVEFYGNHKWIPVTERLPENDEAVLGYLPGRKVTKVKIQTLVGWVVPIHATHWMPLPEPPKEG